MLWLPSGRWGLENVANLDQVPAAGATLGGGRAEGEGCDRWSVALVCTRLAVRPKQREVSVFIVRHTESMS